jgi:gliding motility-associated-like protein
VVDAKCYQTSSGAVFTSSQLGGTKPYKYLWNTTPTQTTANATNLRAGNYQLTVTDSAGCIAKDSTTITEPNELLLGNAIITDVSCRSVQNGKIEITSLIGGTKPYKIDWNSSLNQHQLILDSLTQGVYTVIITDSNKCKATANYTINLKDELQAIAFTDTTISKGNSISINGFSSLGIFGATHYLWQDGIGNTVATTSQTTVAPLVSTKYILTINNDSACFSYDTILIKVVDCGPVQFPNAFSPNNDGIDETFGIINVADVESILKFQIYNRWGQLVFATNDKNQTWDGRFDGAIQEVETYIYYCEVVCYGGAILKTKGDVILIK